MFPTPIQKRSRNAQLTYQTLLPLALIMWLLPLIAVALFSVSLMLLLTARRVVKRRRK